MDFRQIDAFVNVVRYKSFSKAADATFFTQPTISSHISTLEKELGTRLLDRQGRTVEMTAQGKIFYQYAVDMVNTREQAIEVFKSKSTKIEGVLDIQTSSIPGITFLPEAMSEFHKAHPGVQYYVDMSDSGIVIENLLERRGEIGFVGEKINNSALEYQKIFSDRMVMIAPSSYKFDGNQISIEEAVKLPFIWRENGSATRKAFEIEAGKIGCDKDHLNVIAKVNDLNAIERSVAKGLGVSILSDQTVGSLSAKGIKVVEIKGFKAKRDFYMVSLKGRALSSVADSFRKFIITLTKERKAKEKEKK